MKNPNLRSALLVSLMLIVSFAAAWLPVALVRAGRPAQGGSISEEVPQDPPAGELRIGPFSTYNGPRLAGPDDPVEVMVELEDPPAIEAFAQEQDAAAFAGEATSQAIAAARSQIARIEQAQQKLVTALAGPQFKAKITGRVQRVYNGISVHVASGKLAEIHALPGVKAVHISSLIYPATDTSVPFIGAHQVWGSATVPGQRGEGIIIAVIDSGVDYTHANLGGSGLTTVFNSNNPTVIGDVPDFPNAKVIGGTDLVGDNYNASDPNNNTPNPDPDPVDCKSNGHGSGTAGIAAGIGVNANGTAFNGSYVVSTNFSSFRIGPGVAPKANLYAIKVFGCNARGATSSTVLTQAIDRAMDPNQDGNFSDRARVVMLPGSGPFSTLPGDPAITAIDNGALANVIYVGAAGNGGDTYLSAGGPANAAGALSVVLSTDNGLFNQNVRVTNPPNSIGAFPATVTEIGPALTAQVAGSVRYASPANGCVPLANASQIAGNIAFIDRGTCTFTTKVRNAQNAGAVAAIIGNNTATLPVSAGDDGTGSGLTINSFLLAKDGADAIGQELNGGAAVTVSVTPGDNTSLASLANAYPSFNPYGGVYFPTILKPDIAAPGVNIGSTDAGSGNGYFNFTGTSPATPHVAGTAALLVQKYPNGTTRQIYSTLRSTGAKIFSGANSAPPEQGPSTVGGGRVDAQAAATTKALVNTTQTITTTNLYGEVIFPTVAQTNQRPITLNWNDASATSYSAIYNNLADLPGVDVLITNPTGTVPPSSTVSIPYVLSINPTLLKRACAPWISPTQANNPRHCLPEEQGYVIINLSGNQPMRAPIYYVVRPASQMGTTETGIILANPTGTLTLSGQGVDNGFSQPTDPISLASPFELQGIDPNDSLTPSTLDFLDLQYTGVRSNFKTAGSIANTRIIFGLSTYGDWGSPNQFNFNVFIDTNRDGVDDFHLFNTSFPNANGAPSDVFITRLLNISTGAVTTQFYANSFSAATLDTAIFYTDVMSLPVAASDLGLTDANGKFDYQVKTSVGNVVVDQSARFTYDATKSGIEFGASTMFFDLNGGTIPVGSNLNDFRAANSEGALILHHYNASGARAQILPANLGLEGDVAPRPAGNGSTTIADWVQVGRFVAGLDEVNLGNEFQRADDAPRNTSGNGSMTISDWVQAGRYAAGLDQVQLAGGPTTPPSSQSRIAGWVLTARYALGLGLLQVSGVPVFSLRASQTRTLRAVSSGFLSGQTSTLDLVVDALGGENALGFTLNFDPAVLSFVSAELGSAVPGATLFINTAQSGSGRIGIALALPAGQALAAGARSVAGVRFNVVPGTLARNAQVSFGDQPIRREMANVNADVLDATYTGAAITILRPVASVSAASFSGADVAPESIVAAFGTLLATSTEVASTLRLPTSLAGTTVRVKDSAGMERLSPLFFVSSGQINYQIPPGTVIGNAMVSVLSADGAASVGNVNITTVAPGIFAANANGQGAPAAQALRVRADGTLAFEQVARFNPALNQFVPLPIDLGPESDQVFLVLFGTGLRFRSALSAVSCSIGAVNSEVQFAGGQEGFVGLDQVNVRLLRSLIGRGEVDVAITVDAKPANTVRISIK